MVDLDPMILIGYATAAIALFIGLVYGFYKTKRGE